MSRNIFSAEAFLDWVKKQPPRNCYDYCDRRGCAMFQYLKEMGVPVLEVAGSHWIDEQGHTHALDDRVKEPLAYLGLGPLTRYGELAMRLEAAL